MNDQQLVDELYFYTWAQDPVYFIHQFAADAYKLQNADGNTKPIAVTFALVSLYLLFERNYSGKQAQQAHMQLAKNKKPWPPIELPDNRGEITLPAVLATAPENERDELIIKWCQSVWKAYHASHGIIAALVKQELGI